MQQKMHKAVKATTLLFTSLFFVLLGLLVLGTTQRVSAQDGQSTCVYLPVVACSDCSGTPQPSLILTPTLTATYGVTMTDGIQFATAQIITVTSVITNPTITVTTVISYPLYLDLYEPVDAPPGKRAVVMWMFGSGFVNLSSGRKGEFVPIANELAARGYVVVAIDYRTARLNPVVSPRSQPYLTKIIQPFNNGWVPYVYPDLTEEQYDRGIAAAFDDGISGLFWIVGQAQDRSLDISRLALLGSSSGTTIENYISYISNDLGMCNPKIAAMLHLWGGMDYTLAGGLTEIEANEAPLFMIHSINDSTNTGGVNYINAKTMAERAAAVGLPYQLLTLLPDPNATTAPLIGGYGHGLTQVPILQLVSDNGQTLFMRIIDFLDRTLPQS